MKKTFISWLIVVLISVFSLAQAQIKEVAAAEYAKNPAGKETKMLDVRTDWEYKEGHLPGALNFDFNADTFKDQIGKLDRKGHYVLYCFSGGRSANALTQMRNMGFKNIIHVKDGYSGLQKAGVKME